MTGPKTVVIALKKWASSPFPPPPSLLPRLRPLLTGVLLLILARVTKLPQIPPILVLTTTRARALPPIMFSILGTVPRVVLLTPSPLWAAICR